MNNIYPNAARDKMGQPIYEGNMPLVAKVTRASDNAAASSVVTLNDNTTFVEMVAIGATGYMKWIASTDTTASVISAAGTANFDHVLPAGLPLWLPVPQETIGTPSIVGANKQNGLYNRLAFKGAASILTTEF